MLGRQEHSLIVYGVRSSLSAPLDRNCAHTLQARPIRRDSSSDSRHFPERLSLDLPRPSQSALLSIGRLWRGNRYVQFRPRARMSSPSMRPPLPGRTTQMRLSLTGDRRF